MDIRQAKNNCLIEKLRYSAFCFLQTTTFYANSILRVGWCSKGTKYMHLLSICSYKTRQSWPKIVNMFNGYPGSILEMHFFQAIINEKCHYLSSKYKLHILFTLFTSFSMSIATSWSMQRCGSCKFTYLHLTFPAINFYTSV